MVCQSSNQTGVSFMPKYNKEKIYMYTNSTTLKMFYFKNKTAVGAQSYIMYFIFGNYDLNSIINQLYI
jgi:hypothetical protein